MLHSSEYSVVTGTEAERHVIEMGFQLLVAATKDLFVIRAKSFTHDCLTPFLGFHIVSVCISDSALLNICAMGILQKNILKINSGNVCRSGYSILYLSDSPLQVGFDFCQLNEEERLLLILCPFWICA